MNKYFILFLLLFSVQLFAQIDSPKREMRGVWVATVGNIDWPNTTGTSISAIQSQKNDLSNIFSSHKNYGMNAIFFQVRTICDAFYKSKIEPWSGYLTETQGIAPSDTSYDPLQFAIQEAHKRGMELHAWLNPYRAELSGGSQVSSGHVISKHPEWIIKCTTSEYRFLNPGLPEVREYVVNIIMDIVRRYDVDGIHFDDYFYPYSDYGPFNDDATFNKYSYGFTDRASWRKNNVNLLCKMINDSIKAVKPWIKFGISPSGNMGVNSSIYCDPTAWLKGNYTDSTGTALTGAPYIDYILPQLYTESLSMMDSWISSSFLNGRALYCGQAAYRYSIFGNAEFPLETKIVRKTANADGSVFFSSKSITNNLGGCNDSMRYTYYAKPALVPQMSWIPGSSPIPNPPTNLRFVKNSSGKYELTWDNSLPTAEGDTAFAYLVYRFDAQNVNTDSVSQILGITGTTTLTTNDARYSITKGSNYAVTAVNRYWNESEPSSTVRLDSTGLIPAKPSLISPSNNDVNQKLSTTLVWNSVPLAERYLIQVSKYPDFHEIVYRLYEYRKTSLTFNGIEPGQKYYWRVKAFGIVGESEFSEVFIFESGIPAAPVLISPAHTTKEVRVMPTFIWSSMNKATSYHLQIATTVQFNTSSIIFDKKVTDTSYTMTTQLATNKNHYWRVSSINSLGESGWSSQFGFKTRATTDIKDDQILPKETKLLQNYPNPFNPSTVISYQLAEPSNVKLKVFDLLGREVAVLVNGTQSVGIYNVELNVKDIELTSGIYLYQLIVDYNGKTGRYINTKKLILMK